MMTTERKAEAEALNSQFPKPLQPRSDNVHQRKLAVMRRCHALVPDKMHPAHHFPYISIQRLSNELRQFAIDEGLDIVASVDAEQMIIQLVNVDQPEQIIISRWPMVEADKAWAYSFKWALMRLFLIGDGEEGDEAEMAQRSRASTGRRAAGEGGAAPAVASAKLKRTPTGRACPDCGNGDLEIVEMATGARWIGCSNFPTCKHREPARKYVPPALTEAERQAADAAETGQEIPM